MDSLIDGWDFKKKEQLLILSAMVPTTICVCDSRLGSRGGTCPCDRHHHRHVWIQEEEEEGMSFHPLSRGAMVAESHCFFCGGRLVRERLMVETYIYRFPKPRPPRDLSLTKPSPLYSRANDCFIYLLSYYSFLLSSTFLILSYTFS